VLNNQCECENNGNLKYLYIERENQIAANKKWCILCLSSLTFNGVPSQNVKDKDISDVNTSTCLKKFFFDVYKTRVKFFPNVYAITICQGCI